MEMGRRTFDETEKPPHHRFFLPPSVLLPFSFFCERKRVSFVWARVALRVVVVLWLCMRLPILAIDACNFRDGAYVASPQAASKRCWLVGNRKSTAAMSPAPLCVFFLPRTARAFLFPPHAPLPTCRPQRTTAAAALGGKGSGAGARRAAAAAAGASRAGKWWPAAAKNNRSTPAHSMATHTGAGARAAARQAGRQAAASGT